MSPLGGITYSPALAPGEESRFSATRLANLNVGVWLRPDWSTVQLPSDPLECARFIDREVQAELDGDLQWWAS